MHFSAHTRWLRTLLQAFALAALAAGCAEDDAPSLPPSGQRLLVVGWDGATWRLLDPLLAQGRLPNLARLIERGFHAELESTAVPISSAAWVAAVTGKLPGKSGVYTFFEPVPGTYEVELVSSKSVRATPIWRTLTRHDLRSIVFGVPITFPPEPIRGVLVAGMLSPPDADYSWPPELARDLRTRGFVPDLGMWQSDRPLLAEEHIAEQGAIKDGALAELLAEPGWSLAWIVFKCLDVLSHQRYDGDPNGDVARHCERLDHSLGKLLDTVGPDTNVLFLSDHGFTTYPVSFDLRSFLVATGYSVLDPEREPQSIGGGALAAQGVREHRANLSALDLARTRAFPMKCEGHFGGLRLNLAGREPSGIVAPEQRDAVLAELQGKLEALRSADGRPLVVAAWRGEELYPGPYADRLPDLIFETDPEVRVVDLGRAQIWEQSVPPFPDHDRVGVFAGVGPGLEHAATRGRAGIADVAPTALHLLGLPIYDDLDGRVLSELLRAPRAVRSVSEAADPQDSSAVVRWRDGASGRTSEEEAETRRALRGLGYSE